MTLTCKQKRNNEFFQDITGTKMNYVFTEMYEFNLENKLVKNILNSNGISIFFNALTNLSLNNCKIQSINKGIFKSTKTFD